MTAEFTVGQAVTYQRAGEEASPAVVVGRDGPHYVIRFPGRPDGSIAFEHELVAAPEPTAERFSPTPGTRRFRRKPSVIDAVHWDGTDGALDAIKAMGAKFRPSVEGATATYVVTHELLCGVDGVQGYVPVPVHHWVAKAAPNDFYPIAPEAMANWEPI